MAQALPSPLGRGRRILFAALVGTGVLQAAGSLGLALATQAVFDSLVMAQAPAGPAIALMCAAIAAVALGRGAERVFAERVGQSYISDTRALLFRHLTMVPARTVRAKRSGSMMMRFVGDLGALRTWVSLGLARLIVGATAVGAVLVGLTLFAPLIALAVGSVLAAGAIVTGLLGRWLMTASRRSRRHRSRLTGEVTERLHQLGTVQATGQARRERRRVGRRSRAVAQAMIGKARAAGATRGVAEATMGITVLFVLLAGAAELQRGSITPGTVVGALALAGQLSGYVRDLGRVAEYAAGARVAREAALRFLALAPMPERPDAPDLPAGRGAIELDDVHFADALHGVTAQVPAGSTVAIVGHNGAGKSTLAALISRGVDPTSGTVAIDGADLRDVAVQSLRRELGIVSPDLPLLRGSLRRNVRYRHPRIPLEELARVVEQCELDKVVDALPDAWDSDVGEGGRRLSSGQRTRVELARALAGDPRILVLDEADAHLDASTRALLDRLVGERRGTTILITHRAEAIAAADIVWRLEAGRLVSVDAPASAALTAAGAQS